MSGIQTIAYLAVLASHMSLGMAEMLCVKLRSRMKYLFNCGVKVVQNLVSGQRDFDCPLTSLPVQLSG